MIYFQLKLSMYMIDPAEKAHQLSLSWRNYGLRYESRTVLSMK